MITSQRVEGRLGISRRVRLKALVVDRRRPARTTNTKRKGTVVFGAALWVAEHLPRVVHLCHARRRTIAVPVGMMLAGGAPIRRADVGGRCIDADAEEVVERADGHTLGALQGSVLPPERQYSPASRLRNPSSTR